MYLGVDWYPEQWGMELVEEDLDGICELGLDLVRIADFAWDVIEPADGAYDFAFFDEVLDRVRARGLKVMMCVPTATPPRWLVKAHPEVMIEHANGIREPWGARRNYCMNNPYYLQKATDLARAMAAHWGSDPAIVAWQADNEIGHESSDDCYCPACEARFHGFLAKKHGSVAELNRRWGTRFWTQTYDAFEDVALPRPAGTPLNPSLRLDWERFRSQTVARYLGALAAAVHEAAPDAVVLHDFCNGIWDKHFDAHEAAAVLDDVAVNNYPVWGSMKEPLPPARVAFALDSARGFKPGNFWVTEQLIGAQGHALGSMEPVPGQAIGWAEQALEHGCKHLIFFRYRGYTRGSEQLCHGILDASNRRGRRFREVKDFVARTRANEARYQEPIRNRAALVYDYDSEASWRIQPISDAMDYADQAYALYEQLYRRGIGVDVVPSNCVFAEPGTYDLVLVPSMAVMGEKFKADLAAFVEKGGAAVVSFKSAWKDLDGALPFGVASPAGLTELVGATIDEEESLLQGCSRPVVGLGAAGDATVFAEYLAPVSARALVRWDQSPFGDYAAATVNAYGDGLCFYLGGSLPDSVLTAVFDEVVR